MGHLHDDDTALGVKTDARSVQAVFDSLPPVLVLSTALPFPIAWMLWDEGHTRFLVFWLLLHVSVSALRYVSYQRFRRDSARDQHPGRWERELTIGFGAAGFAWSLLGSVLDPATGVWTKSVVGIVISGVASIGLISAGTLHTAYRTFVLWLMAPVVIWKLYFGGPADLSVAVLAVLFTITLLAISRRTSSGWREMIRAQITSDRLTAELAASMREVSEKNANLLAEVAERARAQEEARTAAARLSLALESAGMQTWEYDFASDLVRVAGAPVANLPEDLHAPGTLGNVAALVHPEDGPQLRAAMAAAREPGDLFKCDFRLPVAGVWRWMSSRGRVVAAEDGTRLTMGVTQDVHRRRRTQEELLQAKNEAEAASRAKSQFLANMSHEIRTPLNGIVGMLELLSESALDAEQKPMVQAASRSSEALLSVISNILDISKIEANRMELESLSFDVTRLTEDVTALLFEPATRKGIVLACRVDAGFRGAVLGDPNRLRQVMLNLVANAVKFTAQGEVEVRLEELPSASGDGAFCTLRFSVRDTGVGLTPVEIQRLFEPFSQADMSTSRRFGGVGLGLAISRQLIELMGGAITVDSAPGVGSTFAFTLTLPVCNRAGGPELPSAIPGPRVLIVEDNHTNREILVAQCARFGLQTAAVETAADGLRQLREAHERGLPYAAALLDRNLPGQSGLGLAESVAADPILSGTRLLMLSSSSSVGDRARARAAGVTEFLQKPIRRDDLLVALRNALGASVVAPTLDVGESVLRLVDGQCAGDASPALMNAAAPAVSPAAASAATTALSPAAASAATTAPSPAAASAATTAPSPAAASAATTALSPAATPAVASPVASPVAPTDRTTDAPRPDRRSGSRTPQRLAERSASRPRVLVVEDNEINRQVAAAMLSRLDCDVTLSEGGQDGVAAVVTEHFDLVLMDCQMPVVDGFEATRRIRKLETSPRRVPIVALTANALQGDRERCLDAGMDDYLTKPFSRDSLGAMVRRWSPVEERVETVAVAVVEPGPDDADDPLDAGALEEVRSLDPDGSLTASVITLFVEEGAGLLADIRRAQEEGNVQGLIFAAHTLKSSSGCVGARHVTEGCARLEREARVHATVATPAQVHAIERAFGHASAALLEQLPKSTVLPHSGLPTEPVLA